MRDARTRELLSDMTYLDASTPYEKIMAILLGQWQGRALALATELGIADLLASGPVHINDLASQTNTEPNCLYRLLRALETIDIFSQIYPMVFENSATSKCLQSGTPNSQRSWVLCHMSKRNGQFEAWANLEHSVRTGTSSFEKVNGCDLWEFGRRHPESNILMDESMRSSAELVTPAVTAAYNWRRFPVIADIGGGIGSQLVSILDAAPHSTGILFDQLHVLECSIPHDRVERVEGDFFTSVPKGADAYILRWILHDWADSHATKLLDCLRRSLKPTARLFFIEMVIPEGSQFDFGKWADLWLLALVGGRERTELEFRRLLSASGLKLDEVIETGTMVKVLVAKSADS
jgi:O-methyltransferase domain